ncbi:N-acyl-D-amino-acid deacylase family protein [Aldersonia kunmingensis]|uniref:N-acyl-D-amino-acid deacylase family protein n=1 Tax=Aldersonia kunmingensis TaxID=408066 RepID=UPI00082A4C97|nr:amidohydrolase family protein [Aldersonia kunmingensis]
MTFDTIIRNGRWFDGTGAPSAIRNIGITNGRIAAVTVEDIDESDCKQIFDASGRWVMPGFIDIHTHYDVELWKGAGLAESVRHGVTTVVMGSCSISTVHVEAEDAGDLFGRVEAIPRDHVVQAISGNKTWSNAEEYIAALESLPLGPNVNGFIGHSDLRVSSMGLDRATDELVKPSRVELKQMQAKLAEALDAGFAGMSIMNLKFDKVDGDRCRSRTLPSTYAKRGEFRRLKGVVRSKGRVVQSAPNMRMPLDILFHALQSWGVFRKPLKTSLAAAMDSKANPMGWIVLKAVMRLGNMLGGDFRFQHLPVPFTVYADGIDFVMFEEFGSGEEAMDLADCVERDELMQDEAYRRRFRKDYDDKWGIKSWHRDFFDAVIVECPDPSVIGRSFGQVGLDRGGLHPVDAFLDLVVEHGQAVRWVTTIFNHRPKVLDRLSKYPYIHMGFADSGAHMRNMAFYNMGLRLLKRVRDAEQAGAPFMTAEQAVHRLTGELAEWFGLDAGHLRVGDRADLVIVDPEHLDESVDQFCEENSEQYEGMVRMVNRNDETVKAVLISGQPVVVEGKPTALLGSTRTGSFLRAGRQSPAILANNAAAQTISNKC